MTVTSRVPLRIDLAGAWTDVPNFARLHGGAVVNAAINQYVEGRFESRPNPDTGETGIRIYYESSLPSGAGLGGSAALNICWLTLISRIDESDPQWRNDLAEKAFDLEKLLGILGGKQDQYSAVFGGVNFLQFGESVVVEPLSISPAFASELESRLLLCYSGESRLSSQVHQNVWGAYERGEPGTLRALHSLRYGAESMRDAITSEDPSTIGRLIGESWENQKALDKSVSNERISEMFKAAISAGALSGKACGAGGGGCLLFYAESERRKEVAKCLRALGAREIPFKFDFEGLRLERRND